MVLLSLVGLAPLPAGLRFVNFSEVIRPKPASSVKIKSCHTCSWKVAWKNVTPRAMQLMSANMPNDITRLLLPCPSTSEKVCCINVMGLWFAFFIGNGFVLAMPFPASV